MSRRTRRLASHTAGVAGIVLVGYAVQAVVLVPTLPLWWRMLTVCAPMFAGVLLVQVTLACLGRNQRRRPSGRLTDDTCDDARHRPVP